MISKSEIRKEIFHSTGCEADDWLEGSKRSANAFEGAKKALKKSAQEVLSIATVIKRDLEDGKLDKMEAAEIADYAILQVMRAKDSLINGSQHYENRQLSMQGEIGAYTKLVNHFKVQHDREEAKIRSIEDAIESGEIVIDEDGEPAKQAGRGQITGVRPTAGLAAQRKAEAEAEKNASAEDSPEDGAPSEDVAEAEKPKKKRKKRKTKTEAPEDNAPDGENT